MREQTCGAEPGAQAAALVWKQRFEPRASTGKGEEYKITHGWVTPFVGGSKTKRQFSGSISYAKQATVRDGPPSPRPDGGE
jgi:hypothetical protein